MLINRKRSYIILASMFALAIAFVAFLLLPARHTFSANAVDFKPGRIIDDSTFTNQNSMSPQTIQAFLNSKVQNCQAGHTCLKDFTENGKSAAQIIWEQSQAFSINPQAMIVLLQKEQGLVSDTSPGSYEYTYATGFCVPDGPPPPACQGTYGFTNQLYYAARMFRKIMNNDPSQYTPFLLGNNNIPYLPGCAAPTVFIENRATMALYAYTPYQPNPSVMNYLYSSVPQGDPGYSCAAYGNRNFWRNFTDWFGPTTGEGFVLATSYNDNGDPRQWVIYKGIRRLVPNEEIARAWGFDDLPLAQMTGLYLGSITQASQPVDRLLRASGSHDIYFVDNGNSYKILDPNMMTVWGLNPAATIDVSVDLSRVPVNQGALSYALRKNGSTAVYMMDGDSIRQYSNGNILAAWEGDSPKVIDLSTDYSNKLNNTGSSITTNKAKRASSADQYNVTASQKLYLSAAIAPLYPGSPMTVSDLTMNRLVTSSPASHFIRGVGSSTVYLVDTSRHAISSQELLRAWGIGANPDVNVVNQGTLNLLTVGAVINTYLADVSGQLYLMDGRRITVPSAIDSGYRTSNVYSASSALMAALPAGETASGLLKGFNSSPVYLMDDGSIRHIRGPQDLTYLAGGSTITSVSDYVLNQFTHGGFVGSYLSSGGTNYVIDSGNRYSVSGAVASHWNLTSPDAVDASTISRFSNASSLTDRVKIGSAYYLVRNGKSHLTFNTDMAGIWNLTTSPTQPSQAFMQRVAPSTPLTIFVRSTDAADQRIFVADNAGSNLYHLTSTAQVFNYGYQSGGKIMEITPSDITGSTVATAKNLIRKSSGGESVLDSGAKKAFINGTVQSSWTTGSNISTVSDSFWAYVPSGASISATIKGSGPTVYAVDAGQKRWIRSTQTYTNTYAPFYSVSDLLLSLLPNGADIN